MNNIRYSKALFNIKEAIKQGYKLSKNGKIIGLRGGPLKLRKGNHKYPRFNIYRRGKGDRFTIQAHQFVAFWLYGHKAFTKGLVVRHLDGNPNNYHYSNIKLGTYSENERDKPAKQRSDAAKKAAMVRKANGWVPGIKIVDHKIIKKILRLRKKNIAINKIARDLHISWATINRICKENHIK